MLAAAALVLWLVLPRARNASSATVRGGVEAATAGREGTGHRLRPVRIAAPGERLTLAGVVVSATNEGVPGATVDMVGGAQQHTDDRGQFSIPDLAAGSYLVQATGGDGSSGPVRVHLDRGTAPVVLRLFDAARLSMVVVAKGSKAPVAGAKVEIRSGMYGESALRSGVSDDSGQVRFQGLPSDSYTVTASAPGYQPFEEPVPARAGLEWTHEIALTRGAPVEGRVVDAGGHPVNGATVTPLPAEAYDTFVPISRRSAQDVTTDQDGRFTLSALVAGNFRLRATHPSFLPGWSAEIVSDGKTTHRDIRIEVAPGSSIEGRVVTSSGAPASNAILRVGTVDPQTVGGGGRRTTCDDAGHFRMEGLPRAAVDLVASDEGGSSEAVHVDLSTAGPEVKGVTITLAYELAIAGLVTDPDGHPIPAATVVCVGLPTGAIGTRPVVPETTDGDGSFACRGLPPGNYELTAVKPGSNNNAGPWQRSSGATAEAGDVDVTIVIPNDGGLKGRVRTASGAVVEAFGVSIDTGGLPRNYHAKDGSFAMDGLAPRTYKLEISAPGMRTSSTSIELPEGDTLDVGTIVLAPE